MANHTRKPSPFKDVPGLRNFVERNLEANERMARQVEEIAGAITAAAKLGQTFHICDYLASRGWKNRSGLRTRFIARYGMTTAAYYEAAVRGTRAP